MARQLFYTPTSPYARIARIAIIECGLSEDVDLVLARNRQPDNPTLAHSPVGKVPTLVDGDHVIVETRHVLAYLDHLSGEDRFFPEVRRQDWSYLTLEGMAMGLLDGLAVWGREAMRPEEMRWSPWTDVEAERARRCIPWFDQNVDQLDPGSSCFAALTLGCALDVADRLLSETDWRHDAPRLAAWHAAQTKRDSYHSTLPEPAA